MVVVSYSGREINAKLVYYGTGLSGKTTNLEFIYGAIPSNSRGKMVSMKTQNDRTLFFDLLPVDLGEISGFKTRFMLYTVPGQVFYNATRKLVLRGADAIVFVVDSERGRMQENKDSLQNLIDNLAEYNLSLDQLPWVLQYNKRDLPDVYTVEELNRELNPKGVPWFEAIAVRGDGVFETFRGVSRLLLENLNKELKLGTRVSTVAEVQPAATRAPAFTPEPLPPAEPAVPVPAPEPVMAAVREAPAPVAVPAAPPAVQEPEPVAASAAATELAPLAERPLEAAAAARRAPSLAERFTAWLGKSGKGEPPLPEPARTENGFQELSLLRREEALPAGPAQAPTALAAAVTLAAELAAPAPAASAVSVAEPTAVADLAAPPEAPAAPVVPEPQPAIPASFTPAAPPMAAPEVRGVADDRPLELPDFSGGFRAENLPESIPAESQVQASAPGPEPEPAAPPLERRVAVPVSLHGLRPGQKVRLHLVLEIEAVDEDR
ncbi:MAG TPA: GTPase domain-containing protein [Candidatus Saccharimonadales bacterium]|nr:GTPase domain-containing protein [Candidatus Saccharimonadales bacterium]